MKPSPDRRTIRILIVAMALVAAAVGASAISLLYRTAYAEALHDAGESAGTLANLAEAVARFDQRFSAHTHAQGSWGATMSQIEAAIKLQVEQGSGAEITIGRRVGGELLVMQAVGGKGMTEVARVPFDGRLAQPLYRALNGQRGSGELLDYAGRTVLAGYAPVPTLGIGVTYKVKIADVRAPFVHASLWVAAIAALLIAIGAFSFVKLARPLHQRAERGEQRIAALMAAAPVGVFETDIDGRCTFVNERWCALAGMSKEQALGESWSKALHSDDVERVTSAWQAFVASGEAFALEFRVRRPDGSERWLFGRAAVLNDERGNVLGYAGAVTDISEQIASREAMRLNESRLNDAQALAQVGNWELDLGTGVLLWSRQIFRIFEIDPTQFRPSYEAFLNAIHPGDRDAVNKAYTDSVAKREPYRITHRLQMPDAGIKWVEESCETFYDTDGKPIRSVGTVQDITLRINAEQETQRVQAEIAHHRDHLEELVAERSRTLFESERQLRVAQQIAQLGHWSVHMATGELQWSEEIYRIFGRDRARFTPSYDNFFACIHPDDVAAVKASELAAEAGGRHSVDHRVLRPDGTVRWVHEEAQFESDAEGRTLRMTGTVQDITERKQIEAELIRARDAAERASKAKSDFLSRMSHELRTPMNAILGFAQVLEVEPTLDPELLSYVGEIHRAGDHLLEMINDLLDLSRIESGKLAIAVEVTALAPVLKQAMQIVQPMLASQQVVLREQCGAGVKLLADPTRLRQVLVNLLSNAIKYNRIGGRVDIECQAVDDERLQVRITDTGPGLSEEKISRLFRPFERLGAELTTTDGAGIGLALSKQLAELMGGTLGVASTSGQGSTFWIELPMAREPDKPQAQAPVAALEGEKLRVLYVEDNAANLRVVEAMLRRQPTLQLLSATNGEYGLELARRMRPDIILLDIHLPGMDGFEVLSALQDDAQTRDIPVIALSADAMPIDIETGLRAGFHRYLTKPVKLDVLLDAIAQTLDQRVAS